jgi:hypothetical protein
MNAETLPPPRAVLQTLQDIRHIKCRYTLGCVPAEERNLLLRYSRSCDDVNAAIHTHYYYLAERVALCAGVGTSSSTANCVPFSN